MTPDLIYLALTALLTAVLWIPYIVGQVMTAGMITAQRYRDPTPPEVPNWVNRCNRTHLNAVESLAPFAVLVLIVHVTGGSTEFTATCAMVFFWARAVHAVVYWLGIPFVRTLTFAVGLLATLGLGYHVLTLQAV